MNIKNKIIIYLTLVFISCSSPESYQITNKKSLRYDIVQLNQVGNQAEMQLIIQVPINKMVFEKKENQFKANITIDVLVTNDKDKLVYSSSWDEIVIKKYYEETKANEFYSVKHHFNLLSGNYFINFIVNDFENHISFINNEKFNVIENYDLRGPIVYYKLEDKYLYFLEDNNIIDTLWVEYEIMKNIDGDKTNTIDFSYSFYFKNKSVFKKHAEKEILHIKKPTYIPIPLLKESFDKLKIEISYNDKVHKEEILFDNRIKYNYDLKEIIEPMRYVFDSEEFIYYVSLNYHEQIEYLKKYWKIDNQDSRRYQLFKEFYMRVQHVNEKYNHMNTHGWKTDRGRIYIVHGRPEDIRSEFNQEGEFEIWYYNNKEFIFINEFGRYRLYNRGQ